MLPTIRAKLKLVYLTREYIVEKFYRQRQSTRSVVLSLFIDTFGLYRNMYRALLGIYATPINLNERQRNRRVNVFLIIIGLFVASFEDVIHSLSSLADTNRGIEIKGISFVYAPIIFYSSNIVQQQTNARCLGLRRIDYIKYIQRIKANGLTLNTI